MKPYLLHLPHLKPHTRHVVLACVVALVLLVLPNQVGSSIWAATAF